MPFYTQMVWRVLPQPAEVPVSDAKPTDSEVFDLAAVDRAARETEFFSRDGHTARTLVRNPDLRVVYVAMKEGGHLAEHRANDTASVQVLSGRVNVRFEDSDLEVEKGQLLVIEAGVRHDVEAIVQSALLVTLGWRGDA
jgi:quercetin dioxygenase-like cupin family protein